jgi:hypothetical protein
MAKAELRNRHRLDGTANVAKVALLCPRSIQAVSMKRSLVLAAFAASALLASAPVADAQTQKKQPTQAQKSKAKAKPQPVQDPNYIDLTPPPASGKPPNYLSASQSNSVFRGTSIGTDSGSFPSGFGLDPAPGVR